MSDNTGTPQDGDGFAISPDGHRNFSRELGGILVTHEYAGDTYTRPRKGDLRSHEVASAGGENGLVGEASYGIYEDREGSYGYDLLAIRLGPGPELADDIVRPFPSRERTLVEIADELLVHIVKLCRAHELERQNWLDFNGERPTARPKAVN